MSRQSHQLSAADIIHLMSAPHELQKEWVRKSMSHASGLYHEYMKYAYEPEKRDYPLLREFLVAVQEMHIYDLSRTLKEIVKTSGIRAPDIEYIYDIGAGESVWWKILLEAFPNTQTIFRIDKSKNVTNPNHLLVNEINADIHDYISECGQGPNHLYFMSEWLHCKTDNINLLRHSSIQQSNVIINELLNNMFIDHRLKLTGGSMIKLVDVETVSNQQPWFVSTYQTFFDYYIMAKNI